MCIIEGQIVHFCSPAINSYAREFPWEGKIGLCPLYINKRVGDIQLKPNSEEKGKENGALPFLGLSDHLLICWVLNRGACVLSYRPMLTDCLSLFLPPK